MNWTMPAGGMPSWGLSLLVVVGGFLGGWVLQRIVFQRLREWVARTPSLLDDALVALVQKTTWPLLVYGVAFLALQPFGDLPRVHQWVGVFGKVLIVLLLTSLAVEAFRLILSAWGEKRNEPAWVQHTKRFQPFVSLLIWGTGGLILLDNLGFKITALLAGLGIGGVALALASQAVLGDLFSSFAILLDQPFEVGDAIVVGEFQGTVEHIGIKTTRLRSVNGEQLVVSNTDLTQSRVRNYKRMDTRRVVFKLGLVYDTPNETLRSIPALLRLIIEKTPDTRFDRAHFLSFDDSSLTFEVAYFVLSPDFNRYADAHQSILFQVKSEFENKGIGFAFPTRTVLVSPAVGVLPNRK